MGIFSAKDLRMAQWQITPLGQAPAAPAGKHTLRETVGKGLGIKETSRKMFGCT